jgi:NAD(P)H dehydrogenase (quinone)
VYELAGDAAYTLREFAAEVALVADQAIGYQDMPQAAVLPEGLAEMFADADTGASKGGLFDDSKTLSGLIGRPTTPLGEVVQQTLAA